MTLFKAVNIDKSFAQHVALNKVSIDVEQGSIFGLLGPNGAGKTTLIRIINQITAPDRGELLFNNKPLKRADIENIGYLPEERGLYKKMKVGDQAVYLARLKGLSRNDAVQKLKYWFNKFEIMPWWDKKVEELSKGMQQKVQFIVTILHNPSLLIFDEPFSGFDPINANLLKNEILELKKKGATIIFSTHNMSSVEEICDSIALINNSKKILDGPVIKIREQFKLNQFEFSYIGSYNMVENIMQNFTDINVLGHSKNELNNYLKVELINIENQKLLLSQLINSVHLVSFNEIIPKMDDIFIKVVKQAQN